MERRQNPRYCFVECSQRDYIFYQHVLYFQLGRTAPCLEDWVALCNSVKDAGGGAEEIGAMRLQIEEIFRQNKLRWNFNRHCYEAILPSGADESETRRLLQAAKGNLATLKTWGLERWKMRLSEQKVPLQPCAWRLAPPKIGPTHSGLYDHQFYHFCHIDVRAHTHAHPSTHTTTYTG